MTTMNSMGNMNGNAGGALGALGGGGLERGTGLHGAAGERPRKAVFVITEKTTAEGPRSFWTKVGAAFDNRDGSVTIKLDALPLSGTLQIRDDDRPRTPPTPF